MKTHKIEFADDWKGFIEVRVPKVNERFALMQTMGLKVNAEGEVDLDQLDMLGSMIKILPLLKDFVTNCDLQYGETKITDYEELEYYNEAMALLTQVGLFLMQGASLSKNSNGQ